MTCRRVTDKIVLVSGTFRDKSGPRRARSSCMRHVTYERMRKKRGNYPKAIRSGRMSENMKELRGQLYIDNRCVVSDRIIKKMCETGITFEHLKLSHRRDAESVVHLLLSERQNNKARVRERDSFKL